MATRVFSLHFARPVLFIFFKVPSKDFLKCPVRKTHIYIYIFTLRTIYCIYFFFFFLHKLFSSSINKTFNVYASSENAEQKKNCAKRYSSQSASWKTLGETRIYFKITENLQREWMKYKSPSTCIQGFHFASLLSCLQQVLFAVYFAHRIIMYTVRREITN